MNTTKLWHVETHWNLFFRHTPFMASGYGVWERSGSQFPPPPRVIAEGQLMHFLCALHHARMQMVISPQSLGCYPPLSCSSLTKLRLTSPLFLGYPSGAGRQAGSTLRHTTTLWCYLKSPLEDLWLDWLTSCIIQFEQHVTLHHSFAQ